MDSPLREAKTHIPDVLSRVRLFAGWPDAALERLCAAASLRKYSPGATVLAMNGELPYLVVLARGLLSVQRTLPSGKTVVFDFMMPGQSTSHITVFDGQPNAFDIVARAESEIVLIPREAILRVVRHDADRLFDVIQFLCRRARLDYESIHLRVANTLRCQLAKMILYWGRGSEVPSGFEVPVALSQDEFASLFGNSRQSVNRELARMVKEGMLALRYKRLYVVDVAKMAKIIQDEDPPPPSIDKALFERPKESFPAAD